MTKVEIANEEDVDLLTSEVSCTGAGHPYRDDGDYAQGESFEVKVSYKGKAGTYTRHTSSTYGLVTQTIENGAQAILPQIKEEFRKEIRKSKMVVDLDQLAEFLGAKGEPDKYSPLVKNRVEERILMGLSAINKKLREMPNLWNTQVVQLDSSSFSRRKDKKLPDDLAIPPLPHNPLGVEDKELGFFELEPGIGFLGFSYLMVGVQRESLNQAQEDLQRILKKYF